MHQFRSLQATHNHFDLSPLDTDWHIALPSNPAVDQTLVHNLLSLRLQSTALEGRLS